MERFTRPGDPSDVPARFKAYRQVLAYYDRVRPKMVAFVAVAHAAYMRDTLVTPADIAHNLWFDDEETRTLHLPSVGSDEIGIEGSFFESTGPPNQGTNKRTTHGWVRFNTHLLKDGSPYVASGDSQHHGYGYSLYFGPETPPLIVQSLQIQRGELEEWQAANIRYLSDAECAQFVALLPTLQLDPSRLPNEYF